MKNTLAVALILGLAACGDEPSLAPVAQAAAPKPIAVAAVVEPEKVDGDKELAQRVMRAIDEAKIHGIDAVVVEGVVTLWGTTPTKRARLRAAEIASGVEGVRAVENRVQVVVGS
jgi:osmotically-inducible protein OsmY